MNTQKDDAIFPVMIEIPKGSRNKYEYDKERRVLKFDRMLFSAMHYPSDYGFFPETLAQDGDPLDALVLVWEPTFPGCLIEVKPVAAFKMWDEKGADEKILCVPVSDPLWNHIVDLSDVPPHLLKEIEHFFSVYKDLEEKKVGIEGWEDREVPLTGDGTKIVVHDTDHTHPFNTDPKTPWRSFLRGLNFISMDPYMDCRYDSPGEPVPEFSDIRRQCGYTLQWAQRLNLNAVEPHGDLVSSGYCLSDRDTEYLVYLPNGGEVTVDLSGASENFEVEWFNPQVGESERGEAVNGGQLQDFAAPFEGHAVLFLDRRIGEAYNERSE